jgi:acetyl-CoA carboxylase carboxyltransferase component
MASRPRAASWSAEEEEAFKAPVRDQYEVQGHPYYASARLWDDGVIRPTDTRRVLSLALSGRAQRPDPRDALRRLPHVRTPAMSNLEIRHEGPSAMYG